MFDSCTTIPLHLVFFMVGVEGTLQTHQLPLNHQKARTLNNHLGIHTKIMHWLATFFLPEKLCGMMDSKEIILEEIVFSVFCVLLHKLHLLVLQGILP